MAEKTIRVKSKVRTDTASNWSSNNPILLKGELGYDSTNNKLKVGDGTTRWNSLNYLTDESGSGGGSFEIPTITINSPLHDCDNLNGEADWNVFKDVDFINVIDSENYEYIFTKVDSFPEDGEVWFSLITTDHQSPPNWFEHQLGILEDNSLILAHHQVSDNRTFTRNDGDEPVIINPLGRFFTISTDTYDGNYISYNFPERNGTVALLDDIQDGGSVAPIDVDFAFWEVKQQSVESIAIVDDTLKNKLIANPNTPLKDRDGNYYYPVSFTNWGDEENFDYYIFYYGVYYGATLYFAIEWCDGGAMLDEVAVYSLDKESGENSISTGDSTTHYCDGTLYTKFKMLITCEEDLSGIDEVEITFHYFSSGYEYYIYISPDSINGATVERIGSSVVFRDGKGVYIDKIPFYEKEEFEMYFWAGNNTNHTFTINYNYYN